MTKTEAAIVRAAQHVADQYPAHYRASADPLATALDHEFAVDELLKHLRALLQVCAAHAKATKKGRK